MWIKSQDGTTIVNTDKVKRIWIEPVQRLEPAGVVHYQESTEPNCWLHRCDGTIIAVYSTLEEAEETLEFLLKKISDGDLWRIDE